MAGRHCFTCNKYSAVPLADGYYSRPEPGEKFSVWECGCTIEYAGEQKPVIDAQQERINRYDERRTLTDGRIKDTLTGFVDYPLWVDKDECDKPLENNRG